MNFLKLGFVLTFTIISLTSFSQDSELLTTLPTTKEEFVKSEASVINTINWLESTPLDQETKKRQLLSATFIAWLTNSPTVTINMNSNVLPFTKKNSELLITFLGGWTRYTLQNSYSKDTIQCNLAGIKSAIKVYQTDKSLKKDKQMEKIIELDTSGKLEEWIAEQLSKK